MVFVLETTIKMALATLKRNAQKREVTMEDHVHLDMEFVALVSS